ncbi:hypothetical protein ACWC09_16215 [Streptomyces sp. NPDC001617]
MWIRDPADLKAVLCDLIDGPLGLRQRATGLVLFARTPDGGPAAEIARVHRTGVPGRTPRPAARRRRRTTRRLAATAALASAVWAGAVSTGVATTMYGTPDLIHAIGHRLDPDGFPPDHTASRSGDRHS